MLHLYFNLNYNASVIGDRLAMFQAIVNVEGDSVLDIL